MQLPHGRTPRNFKPRIIVIHAMGEYIEGGDRDFTAWEWLDRLGLSAHALITPSGVVIRCRDDQEGAFHAKGFNESSLGVEFLVPGVHTYGSFLEAIEDEYVTEEQYVAGVELVTGWIQRGRELGRTPAVMQHSELSPGRKHDPGMGFPWFRFIADLGLQSTS